MNSIRRAIHVLALFSVAGLIACGEEAPAPEASKEVMPGENRVENVETPTGEKVQVEIAGAGAMVDSFPSDLPVYPGASTTRTLAVPGRGSLIGLETGDAPEKVFAFYSAELPKQGWALQTAPGSKGRVEAAKGNRTASVTAVRTNERTEIGIILGEK